MNATSTGASALKAVLPLWHQQLQSWAQNGRLLAAAQEALMLQGTPKRLEQLIDQWATGNFRNVPEIVLLPNGDINGAMGAYAISTRKIYLNQNWLQGASIEQVISVLTEELGHHLDGELNDADTPGDEGEYLASQLSRQARYSTTLATLREQKDKVEVVARGQQVVAEAAALVAIRGNSLYSIVNGPSWEQAEADSVLLGGHLVTIDSEGENNFLTASLSFPQTPVSSTNATDWIRWIGLSDAEVEGVWKWASGVPLIYSNWEPGKPDNAWGGQNYGLIYYQPAKVGKWDDTNPQPQVEYWNAEGIAEIPLTLSISRQGEVKEGSGTFTTSINLSAGTATSGNLAEGAQIWWRITGITEDDLASGELGGTGFITNGKLDVQHSLLEDADSGENLEVTIFSDSLMTQQIGNTSSANIGENNAIIGPMSEWEYQSVDSTYTSGNWKLRNTGWITGLAPFGNTPGGDPDFIPNTWWNEDGADGIDLITRKTFSLSAEQRNGLNFYLGVDNGARVFVNGFQILDVYAEGYTYRWEYSGKIPAYALQQGANTIVVELTDNGGATAFDLALEYTRGTGTTESSVEELIISVPGSGTVNGTPFTDTYLINLDVGSDTIRLDESFIHPALSPTPLQLMTVDAGGDNDTFYGNSKDNILILTGINQGTLDGIAFTNVENIDLLGGDDKVYIRPGGQLTGTLNGGSGTYYLPREIPDPISGPPRDPIPDPIPFPTPDPGPKPPIEGGLNSFYLNDDPNILDLTGPGAGVIDGTNFVNFAAIDMRGGNDTANIAAAGSLIKVLDGGADRDTLNLNDAANTISLAGDLKGTIKSATGPLTSIANFEVFNLAAGSDTAIVDLNQITASSVTARQSVTINGGTDSGTDTSIDTLRLTLTDADINALQTNGTVQALLNYLAKPTGLTYTAALANIDLTLTSFESASLTNTLAPLPTTKSYSGDYDFTITGTATSGRVVATQKVKVGRKTSTVTKIDETFANVQTVDITAGASANIINAQGWTGDSKLKGEGGNDTLTGGTGITTYTGGLGCDKFRFVVKPEFTAALADHITDFNSTQADKIEISRSTFGIAKTVKVSVANGNGSIARDAALAKSSLFVYDSSTGELWWNQNGATAGAGTGGVFAILDDKPASLAASAITLIA